MAASEQEKPKLEGKTCTVHTLQSFGEQVLVEDALDEADIPFAIQTTEDLAFDGAFTAQKGFGRVLVLETDKARARQVIESCLKEARCKRPE
ncbi:MAG: hypothetical protein FJ279_23565 [Planctomycetes bacterium]|nr:hypothetical protein [Planctomycetota bacterium]